MEKRQFKVTKTISSQLSYRPWKEYDEGDVIIGKFVGIHVCKYEKDNIKIEVLEAQFKDGTGDNYTNKVLVINHCGALEKAMEQVEEGEYVQIEYTGLMPLTKGKFAGKDCHTVAVSVVELDEGDFSGL